MSDEPIILSRCCPTCERLTAENAALREERALIIQRAENAEAALEGADRLTNDAWKRLAEAEALRKDAEARSLYDRTAAAHGFANAPHWNDLAEETRQMYRDERAKRDAAMGESHAE
jgi:hypothetical protein